MLDFTSALYLGMVHPWSSLRPWDQLTSGRPAALSPPDGAQEAALQLAELQGCKSATLGTSTLHLFWDLFDMLAAKHITVYPDAGIYPIARWGIEHSAMRGLPVKVFNHHDSEMLRKRLRNESRRPVVVTDGFCPGCGEAAPIAEYVSAIQSKRGYLVVDDTQALGILGAGRSPAQPYGHGGSGSLRWNNVQESSVIAVSSLAKGFGVPLAVLAGDTSVVQRYESVSQTRIHCSPPCVALVHATERALELNRAHGDALRAKLWQTVSRFRECIAKTGWHPDGGFFPVQTIRAQHRTQTLDLHEYLLRSGIRTVLQRGRTDAGVRISFLITARHRPEDVESVARIISRADRHLRPNRRGLEENHEQSIRL
jgi:8-amino-7-oxononanoate synthase